MPIIDHDEKLSELARSAARKLGTAEAYFRTHDFQDMTGDLRQLVRRTPRETLLAAAITGFVAGCLVRRQ